MELSDEETERRLSLVNDNRDYNDDDPGIRSDEAEEEPRARKNSDEDEDEDTKRRVDASTSRKRIVKNPQPKLNAERIQGPKGVQTIEKYFEGFKFSGKGHEKRDLNRVMKRLEHWAHRLFPKYRFDDFIEKMEVLGTKKNVQVFLKKYRLGMINADDSIIEGDVEDMEERGEENVVEQAPIDEFDKLIAEQIGKQRANERTSDLSATTEGNILGSAATAKTSELSDEIKARIEANRKIAIERTMARTRRLREEEEEKERQKLEDSRKNSQMAAIQAQIREEVSDNAEESSDTESTRKRQKLENFRESSQMARIKSQIRKDNLDKSIHAESAESSPVTTKANGIFHTQEIYREDQESSEQSLPELEEVREISPTTRAIEGIPERTGHKDLPRIQRQSVEKNANDSERLLTHEELLMAIDGAMEEIIGK